ncbi:SusC/RagA family TonB-linked outer membrane protein [Rhizosphaericola mali]|uniref:SusC/RagA family TonB-linked outer membrane protein n=1 Tax=Rhizosphaericola mali TaxID=2545455 RepID=A0A5P2GAN1_9BACT|nr:SusC/RagA family TonB-linked outer membrane protein [Rhizosphaericola mali]QES88611.1 SusC/RagA family TonB-linked outer membrane protein [Rhizosphaericola mali]
MMKIRSKKLCFLSVMLLGWFYSIGQQVKLNGVISDQETGKPIAHATIRIKNGVKATESDSSGNFHITVPSSESILSITMVGYKIYEIKAGTQNVLNIKLIPFSENMDEVIVVGYGSQSKANVTGAIVPVDMKTISDMPTRTITEALAGQIPGLNISGGNSRPGVDALASIRQTFSFSTAGGSSSLPMVVIDDVIQLDPNTGLPSMDQFNLLDPSDVESISVIKDGAAAIYGSRASQGAIIVKTKRGKVGTAKISYSGKFETNNAVGFVKTMNAYDYGVFSNRYGRAAGWASTSFYGDAELNAMKSLNYDWLNQAWKSAGLMQHSLNVSGGSDKATYFSSITYFTQGANLGSQDYDRWTFRTGTDIKVSNNLKLSATVSANNDDLTASFTKVSINDGSYANGAEQTDYSVLAHMPKYIPWQYEVNGVEQYVSPSLGANRVATTPVGQNNISGWNYFGLLNNGSKTTTGTGNYNANFSLQYDIPFVKGLSIRGSYGITYTTSNTEQNMLPQPLAVATNTNTTGHHLYNDSTTWFVGTNVTGSRITYSDNIGKVQQANIFINYDNTFGAHHIAAMVSAEKGKQDAQTKFMLYDSPTAGYNGASTTAGTLNTSNSYVYRYQFASLAYLGRVSYDYNSKYLAQFVFRSDASTKFSPKNYWGFFPGVSVGWIISRENWFKVSWINNLKIRASMAKTGYDNIAAWRWSQTYSLASDKGQGFGTSGGTLVNGVTPNVTPNPNVKWDQDIQHNIGLDVSILNGKLTFTADQYFDKHTKMLMPIVGAAGTPISVGGAFAEQNYGGINTWGSEYSVTWKDHIGEVKYKISMNFGTSGNKITKYPDVAFNYPSYNNIQVGQSTIMPAWGFEVWRGNASGDGLLRTQDDIDKYWAYLTDLATKAGTTPSYLGIVAESGIKPGMLAYQDLAGNLNADTKTIAGPNGQIVVNQDYAKLVKRNRSHGVNTNLSFGWRSITLDAQISTSWGGYNSIDYIKQGTSTGQIFWSHESYLTDMFDPTDNPNGKWPNLAYYSQNSYSSDFWQISNFRSYLRSLVVGCAIPREVAKKLHTESLRVSFSGYNLWDFYNPYPNKYRTMYDSPTVGYPTLRTWSFGINATF